MRENKKVIVAIGSNYEQKDNVTFAKKQLKSILGENSYFSQEIWTRPVGIESEDFLNCICISKTHHNLKQLESAFKRIERQCQRCVKNDRENKITLDIDILQYGDDRFHMDDWQRDYVQQLLEDFEDDRQMFIIDPTL